MQNRRDTFRKTVKGVALALVLYAVAYIVNSAAGGYWMIPSRVRQVRPQMGAIMWQPRFGHTALRELDYFGAFFGPLIALDRTWIHPTHYDTSADFDTWLEALPSSRVHPKFREPFLHERARRSPLLWQRLNFRHESAYPSTDPGNFIVVGFACTIGGLLLIWKAIAGDTSVPGRTWTRVPRSTLWVMGLVLQTPFPLAYISLRHQGLLLDQLPSGAQRF